PPPSPASGRRRLRTRRARRTRARARRLLPPWWPPVAFRFAASLVLFLPRWAPSRHEQAFVFWMDITGLDVTQGTDQPRSPCRGPYSESPTTYTPSTAPRGRRRPLRATPKRRSG